MRKPKPPKFLEIIVLDTLGVLFMVAAIATGWLPGPGGIPLFILGLSLLAINHEWAKRHIDRVQDYVNKLNDMVFVQDKDVQLAYDIICPLMVVGGAYLLWQHSAPWTVSIGIFLVFASITVLLGNRKRWQRFRKRLKRKH